MEMATKEKIIAAARSELAIRGFDGSSMRTLAKKIGIVASVLYYHFPNKNELLKSVYLTTNKQLGIARSQLIVPSTFKNALKQRIIFQFDHAEEITAVLKYYFHFRQDFIKNSRGFLPENSYLHIEEILLLGEVKNEYSFPNMKQEAKVIVHAINGFVLEYFPSNLEESEKLEVVDGITDFIMRAISPYKL
jgi:AcrR family transcriptional regulator